jgi:predicted nucleotidyltransferase
MDIFFDPHRNLLRALLNEGVEFIIIGGFAVNFHGYNRPTGDVDIWLKPTEDNKKILLKSLVKLGFDDESLSYVDSLDFNEMQAFSIGSAPFRFDFLTKINLVSYDDADKQKHLCDIEGLKIPILHLNHLVLSKINSDRAKDKADVEELQKISRNKTSP